MMKVLPKRFTGSGEEMFFSGDEVVNRLLRELNTRRYAPDEFFVIGASHGWGAKFTKYDLSLLVEEDVVNGGTLPYEMTWFAKELSAEDLHSEQAVSANSQQVLDFLERHNFTRERCHFITVLYVQGENHRFSTWVIYCSQQRFD